MVFVALVVAAVGSLGAPLIISVARTYRVSLAAAHWTLTVTLLTGAVAIPLLGRLGDGPRRRATVVGTQRPRRPGPGRRHRAGPAAASDRGYTTAAGRGSPSPPSAWASPPPPVPGSAAPAAARPRPSASAAPPGTGGCWHSCGRRWPGPSGP